jgi:hypothetical protein
VPLSRAERQGLKAARRAGLAGGALLDDFADDVADLVQVGLPGPEIRVLRVDWLVWRGCFCGRCSRPSRLCIGSASWRSCLAAPQLSCSAAVRRPPLLLSK